MSVTVRTPTMTRDQFFEWAEAQDRRYESTVVTGSPSDGASRLVPAPLVVFEVISPTSGHMDRIVKVREHAAVDSIRRYVIVESASVGLMVHERQAAGERWTVTTAIAEDALLLPEIGIEIPVSELYEGIAPPPATPSG